MTQHNNIALTGYRFTRVDATALRYKLNKIPTEIILHKLYDEDTLLERGILSPEDLDKWLTSLFNILIDLSLTQNPSITSVLESAKKKNIWTSNLVDYLVNAGEKDYSAPLLSDPLSLWFKSIAIKVFKEEGFYSVKDLKNHIEKKGNLWYKPIPRIGPGKAAAIENWFKHYESDLGTLHIRQEELKENSIILGDVSRAWVPIEKIKHIRSDLDGSLGLNRNTAFCLVKASNDLQALHTFLYKYRDKAPTYRAYKKELERFLLWCVTVQKIPLSSVLTEECEAYKDFLANPPQDWIGPKAARRNNARWRPFTSQLSPESQTYAIWVLRACFDWLVKVRYLNGNPWATVSDPRTQQKELAIDIDKALPQKLWLKLASEGGLLDQVCQQETIRPAPGHLFPPKSQDTQSAQFRLARAIILLIGYTGIRREEAATAIKGNLQFIPPTDDAEQNLWSLKVLGKRSKWRTVYLPQRAMEALKSHWEDRLIRLNTTELHANSPLIGPIVILKTTSSNNKHENVNLAENEKGFSADGLYRVVRAALARIADNKENKLTPKERSLLKQAAPHAFRHTFATHATANDFPLDVLQRVMGHASPQTTAIYVQAERARSIVEARKLFSDL